MTEERFGLIIENAVESAADKFSTSLNRAWKHRPVRYVGKSLVTLSGLGLMASYIPLSRRGKHTAAKTCLISGGIIVAANVLEFLIF